MIEYVAIAEMCQVFQCLPDPGGLLDQNPGLMNRLAIVYKAQADKDKLNQEIEEKRSLRTGS